MPFQFNDTLVLMRTRLLAVGITVLALCACSDDRQAAGVTPTTPTPTAVTPPAPAPPTPTPTPTPTLPTPTPVRGRVVDFQTARPISGAVVAFSESGPVGMNQTAITDANGQYVLPGPPILTTARSYYVVVNNRSVGSAYLNGANNRAGDVAVHDGPCVTRYGMVLDRTTYRPIVDAQILNLSNRVIATTDRDGWYQFDFGCLGPYGFNSTWVIATHPDYTAQSFSGGRGWSRVLRDDVLLTRLFDNDLSCESVQQFSAFAPEIPDV